MHIKNDLKNFSDLESIYRYIEDGASNIIDLHQISNIFIKFRDHSHEENKSDDENKAQWEIDVFNFIVKDGDVKPRFSIPNEEGEITRYPNFCLLYTSPSPRD